MRVDAAADRVVVHRVVVAAGIGAGDRVVFAGIDVDPCFRRAVDHVVIDRAAGTGTTQVDANATAGDELHDLRAGIAFDETFTPMSGLATPESATVKPSNVTLGCEIITT